MRTRRPENNSAIADKHHPLVRSNVRWSLSNAAVLIEPINSMTVGKPEVMPRIGSAEITFALPVIRSEPQQFRQADFIGASRKLLHRPVPVAQSLAHAQTRHPVSRLLGPRSDGALLITE